MTFCMNCTWYFSRETILFFCDAFIHHILSRLTYNSLYKVFSCKKFSITRNTIAHSSGFFIMDLTVHSHTIIHFIFNASNFVLTI